MAQFLIFLEAFTEFSENASFFPKNPNNLIALKSAIKNGIEEI